MADAADVLKQFQWRPEPAASAAVRAALAELLVRCPAAAQLSRRLSEETGTRMSDWLDHIEVPAVGLAAFHAAGFTAAARDGAPGSLAHPGGLFPAILPAEHWGAGMKVESISDAVAALAPGAAIVGDPDASLRTATIAEGREARLRVVERLGYDGYSCCAIPATRREAIARHRRSFAQRRRALASDAEGFAELDRLVAMAIAEVGRDIACDLFFAGERAYWQGRNRAARVQKARQDALGLGWGNDDHHTYRSSRTWFARMITLFERLGFVCRERFYAGREAGWGAQVLEHAVTGIVIFADVDLSPEELVDDFAHAPLASRDHLGTVGLWCALHGEAVLQAGMHHLEATFAFDAARAQLAAAGVPSMKPFTDEPWLRQCFTEGERWPVDAERVDHLLAAGLIEDGPAAQFRDQGAIGSHLEILERNDGFKGFNQHGVSEIIRATDPRRDGGRGSGVGGRTHA